MEWECHLWACRIAKILITSTELYIILVKHKRFRKEQPEESSHKEEENEIIQETKSPSQTPSDLKSYVQSVSKYIYIIASAAFLSGIFTPLIINSEITTVIYGILTILLGLGGGILVFLSTKSQKFRSIMVCAGLGMMIISLVIMYELADRSIIQ